MLAQPYILCSFTPSNLLSSILYLCSLQQKHQAVEKEINGRGAHFRFTCQAGERLRKEGHYAAKGIGTKVVALQDKWKKLNELATSRTTRLEEAVQYQQVRHLWLHYHCYIGVHSSLKQLAQGVTLLVNFVREPSVKSDH